MKIKILVKGDIAYAPKIIHKGDWIDLRSNQKVTLHAPKVVDGVVKFDTHLVQLGVCMQLPRGFEGHALARSSTFKTWKIMLTNGKGIIDNTYCGDTDEWKCPIIAFDDGVINIGDAVCQFRIQLSQKATIWQKLKWLFSNKIELEYVNTLNNESRGGIGTTGVNGGM